MRAFKELNQEELLKVFEVNSKLEEQVFNDMFDNAHFWNTEYLDSWNGGIDYCIGYDRGTYFNCTDEELFLDGLKKAQEMYGFLADEYNPVIEYTDKILDSWHKQNVHHLTDVAKLDSNYQNSKKAATTTNKATTPNRFHNFNQRTYDYDQLEQQLLASCSSQEVTCR